MIRPAINPAECLAVGRHDALKRDRVAWDAGTIPAPKGARQYYSDTEYYEVACCAACTSLIAFEAAS